MTEEENTLGSLRSMSSPSAFAPTFRGRRTGVRPHLGPSRFPSQSVIEQRPPARSTEPAPTGDPHEDDQDHDPRPRSRGGGRHSLARRDAGVGQGLPWRRVQRRPSRRRGRRRVQSLRQIGARALGAPPPPWLGAPVQGRRPRPPILPPPPPPR